MNAILHIGSSENERPSIQHKSPKIACHTKRGSKCSQLEYKTTSNDAIDFFVSFVADQLTRDMRNMTMVAGHSQDSFFGDGNKKWMKQITNHIIYNTSQSNIFISGEPFGRERLTSRGVEPEARSQQQVGLPGTTRCRRPARQPRLKSGNQTSSTTQPPHYYAASNFSSHEVK